MRFRSLARRRSAIAASSAGGWPIAMPAETVSPSAIDATALAAVVSLEAYNSAGPGPAMTLTSPLGALGRDDSSNSDDGVLLGAAISRRPTGRCLERLKACWW